MRYKRKQYNAILFSVINSEKPFFLPLKSLCEKEVFIITNLNILNPKNRRKGCSTIFKGIYLYNYLSKLVFLFFSCRITLKVIFYHFHNYLFKVYKCINQHFEKPYSLLLQQHRSCPLFLHLKQWLVVNEKKSLMELHYAQIKRNPE